MKINKLLGLLVLAVGASGVASASAILCAGVSDVTTIGSGGCYVSGNSNIIFSAFSDSFTGAAAGPVGISSNTSLTNVTGGDVSIGFQFPSPAGNGDVLVFYTVTGGIDGIDVSIQAVPSGNSSGSVTVVEIACSVDFTGAGATCPGADVLGTINTTTSGTNPDYASASFATTQTVYIKKDIGFNSAGLSELSNSQMTATPEPMTLSLLGVGLLGLGLVGRKFRK